MSLLQNTDNRARFIPGARSKLPVTLIIALGGALIGLIGLFLPWISVNEADSFSAPLIDNFNAFGGASRSDGAINLINDRFLAFMQEHLYGFVTLLGLGVFLAAVLVWTARSRIPLFRYAVLGIASVLILIAIWNAVVTYQAIDAFASANVTHGIGFYLTEVGSAVAFVGSLVWFIRTLRLTSR